MEIEKPRIEFTTHGIPSLGLLSYSYDGDTLSSISEKKGRVKKQTINVVDIKSVNYFSIQKNTNITIRDSMGQKLRLIPPSMYGDKQHIRAFLTIIKSLPQDTKSALYSRGHRLAFYMMLFFLFAIIVATTWACLLMDNNKVPYVMFMSIASCIPIVVLLVAFRYKTLDVEEFKHLVLSHFRPPR